MKRVVVHLLIAFVVAGLVGVGAETTAERWRTNQISDHRAATQTPPDRVAHAVQGLRDDGVHVSPDGRSMLNRAGERQVARAIREATLPVRVVVWAPSSNAGGRPFDVRAHFTKAYADERGVVIIWEGPQAGQLFTTGQRGWVDGYGTDDFAGDPATSLVEAVTRAQDVHWTSGDTSGYWGGIGGAIAAGILFGCLGAAAFMLLLGLLRLFSRNRLRLPGGWR